MKIGDLGADITTDTGEIYLKNVNGVCNPLYVAFVVLGPPTRMRTCAKLCLCSRRSCATWYSPVY